MNIKYVNLIRLFLFSLVLVTAVQAGELKPYSGKQASPGLSLIDLQGQTQELKTYRGKVVLLNFWATWCPPCRVEMPSMWRLKNKLRNKPFEIIAVNMGETEDAVRTFLPDKMEKDFIVLMDKEGDVLKSWRIFAFPTSFLIDKKGKIRFALYGALEWDEPDAVEKIEILLQEK